MVRIGDTGKTEEPQSQPIAKEGATVKSMPAAQSAATYAIPLKEKNNLVAACTEQTPAARTAINSLFAISSVSERDLAQEISKQLVGQPEDIVTRFWHALAQMKVMQQGGSVDDITEQLKHLSKTGDYDALAEIMPPINSIATQAAARLSDHSTARALHEHLKK